MDEKNKTKYTGIILAGGLNSRFRGRTKALLKLKDLPIIEHIYRIFEPLFSEIILVTNEPLKYLDWNLNIAVDIFNIRSSLTGIHTGLFYSTNQHAFFSASDTPFLKKEIVQTILAEVKPQLDVIVPKTDKGLEPLCAVYSKQCIKPIENLIARKDFKIQNFFDKVKVEYIKENRLTEKDPKLSSFFNINSESDLKIAKEFDNNV